MNSRTWVPARHPAPAGGRAALGGRGIPAPSPAADVDRRLDSARRFGHSPATFLMAPQTGGAVASASPVARGAPIQRTITYSGGSFTKSKRRPAWTTHLKRHVVDRYNDEQGASIPYKQNVGKLKPPLDRAHIYGFANIQNALLGHVQGNLSEKQFRASVLDALYGDSTSEEYQRVDGLTRDLQKLSGKAKAGKANTLLKHLNSATGNVRLGDASQNRRTQEKLDFNFNVNSKGQSSFTPNSRRTATRLPKGAAELPFSPGKTSIESSGSGAGKSKAKLDNLTPRTKKAVKKFYG